MVFAKSEHSDIIGKRVGGHGIKDVSMNGGNGDGVNGASGDDGLLLVVEE